MVTSQLTPAVPQLQSSLSAEGQVVKRVLVAVKGGSNSEPTAIYAADLVRQLHADMMLINVFPTGYSSSPDIVFSELEQRAMCTRDATVALEALKGKILPDLKVELLLREGEPAAQIVKAARDCNVDLIIIGTPAHGWLTRTILGSVTHSIMQHAPCPVLTVPHGPQDRRSG